ncbi:Oligopeptide transport ATP-binding protein OppF [subsurface metagenome]
MRLPVFYFRILVVTALTNNILFVDHLEKYFFTYQGIVKAVDGISFFIKEGETFGLVGESGSGKSTVAYTVVGMYRPTKGKIIYKGDKDISQDSRKRPLAIKKEGVIIPR